MRWPLWLKIGLTLIIFSISVLLLAHFVINHQKSLRFILSQIKNSTGTDIQTSQISFNGFTGYFHGDSLRVVSAKKKFELELGEFQLRLNAAKIFFGELEIEDIQTNKFNLKFTPQTKAKKLSQSFLQDILEVLYLTKADLTHVTIAAEGSYQLSLQQLQLKAGYPLFFNERSLDIIANKASLQSSKIDAFIDLLKLSGTLSQTSGVIPIRLTPTLDAELQIENLLLAFSKKPNPWSANPGYDTSIEPILKNAYGDTIPDNRTFTFINSIALPFELKSKGFSTGQIVVNAFEGQIRGVASYLDHKLNVKVETAEQITWGLLPLGKSNLRLSYQHCDFDFSVSGLFKDLSQNKLSGSAKIVLSDNLVYPKGPNIEATIPLSINNGIIKSDNLTMAVGLGAFNSKASVDLLQKKIQATLNGSDIDTRAVIRLFSSIDIPGTAHVSGNISGMLNNPTFDLKLTSPQFGYESITAGTFDGSLKIKDKTLELVGQSTLGDTGSGKIKMRMENVFTSSEQTVDLQTSFTQMPASETLGSKVIKGTINGFYNLTKQNQVYSGGGDIRLEDGFWYAIPIKLIDITLKQEDKYLKVVKNTIHWNESSMAQSTKAPLVFHFLPDGSYDFTGPITPSATLTGSYKARDPHVSMMVDLKKSPLVMLKPLIKSADSEPTAQGTVNIKYILGQAEQSTVESNITFFDFSTNGQPLQLLRPSKVNYHNKVVEFNNTNLLFGRGKFDLNGKLGLIENSSLKIKGELDVEAISEFTPFLTEGSGLVGSDIEWTGPYIEPAFKGKINFNGTELKLRTLTGELNEINGSLLLDGNKLTFNNVTGTYSDAPLSLSGWFQYNTAEGIYAADFGIKGTEFSFARPDSYRILTDLDVKLTGQSGNLKLSGLVNLIEGTYFRDYSLSSYILKPVGVSYPESFEIAQWLQKLRLDLNVKSSGEFIIDNNITDLSLKGDIVLNGEFQKPQINGTIDVLDGSIHAFGLDFEDARGFVNFDVSNPYIPYIDFVATQDIQNYLVKALIRGRMDNLELSFESQPALNKNEVVSLIAFGRTPDQLNQSDRNLFSRAAIASQIVGIIQRPLSRATNLDVVKLDSNNNDNEALLTELSIGKKLSDRVTFAFTTDLSLDQAYKGLELEYRLLDNLLLKGSKDTGSKYRFDLTWRLEAY